MNHFSYTREVKEYVKDSEDNQIPLLDEKGLPTNEFETQTVTYQDTLNLDLVIRSFRADKERLIVLLNDGHETTEYTPELINPKKAPTMDNIKKVKNTVWVQSEIVLKELDIERFIKAIGA